MRKNKKMKNIILLLVFIFQGINTFSQKSNPYYLLKDACEESNNNCWKLYLCWNEDLQDYSTVDASDILFVYFPDNNSNCSGNKTYRLKPESGSDDYSVWHYKDAKIDIRVRMKMVETCFGYSLSEIKLKSKKTNHCFGTLSFIRKF
jgi:hypothetical protein